MTETEMTETETTETETTETIAMISGPNASVPNGR